MLNEGYILRMIYIKQGKKQMTFSFGNNDLKVSLLLSDHYLLKNLIIVDKFMIEGKHLPYKVTLLTVSSLKQLGTCNHFVVVNV